MKEIKYSDIPPEARQELIRLFDDFQTDIHPQKHVLFSDLSDEEKQEVLDEFSEEILMFLKEQNLQI